jgi:hypothetical protein
MGRNRRGNRPASMKARLAIATAVLVGGGAIGAVAVATSHNSTSANAASAGYSTNWGHQRNLSYGWALSTALNQWGRSQQNALSTLSMMAPMRTFGTQMRGRTMFAAQRGVVILATHHWFLVQSANGKLGLWFFSGHTQFTNVSNSAVGTSALTGNTFATTAAMAQNNMVPATQVLTGMSTLTPVTTPQARPVTVTATVNGAANVTVTITITSTTATIAPSTTTAAVMTQTSMNTMTTAPVFARWNNLMRGDLVLVAGVKSHNIMVAHLVLFTPPTTVTPVPSATATLPIGTPTGTAHPTPSTTSSTFSGTNS